MTKLPKFLAVAALLAGCGDYARTGDSPADIFYFPTGLAVGHVLTTCPANTTCTCQGGTAGCRTVLYVASSNFDLRYDLQTGGSVMAVDPDSTQKVARVGNPVPIASFAGELELVDAATCPGWTGKPLALVASRSANLLYSMPLAEDGAPTCEGCQVPLFPGARDPYAIAVACRDGARDVRAFVSFLTTAAGGARLQQLPLLPQPTYCPPASDPLNYPECLLVAPVASPAAVAAAGLAFDRTGDRVFLASQFAGSGTPFIHYWDMRSPGNDQIMGVGVAGETTALAVSSDGRRAYVALRLFDPVLASQGRPADIGGALAVLDISERPEGGPWGGLLRVVPVGMGPATVRVVKRSGLEDLVAVTCSDDATFHLYDDEVGVVAAVIGADARGKPLLGYRPLGLAVESPYFAGTAFPDAVRFFVASFDGGNVSLLQLDDPTVPGSVRLVRSDIRPERP